VIPKRHRALNFSGVRWVAENAAMGVAKASPVRIAAGIARTISGDAAAPKRTITKVKIAVIIVRRTVIQATLPRTMSRGVIGVAYIAWKVRCQVSPLMIGKVDSNEAACIAVAARSPGARNCRYVRPPSAWLPVLEPLTYVPNPMPMAVRNRIGLRNELKIEARNVRRYSSARCSTTRVMTAMAGYSISERPVSRRKTSSRVDRRTSTVSGRRPRSCAAVATASPSSS